MKKINLKAVLQFWLLSNAEVQLEHCSATKTTKNEFKFILFNNFHFGRTQL